MTEQAPPMKGAIPYLNVVGAADAGLEVMNPVALKFWGDRWGSLKDPFGVHWTMNQPADQA